MKARKLGRAAGIDLLPSLQQPDTSTSYPTSDLGQALATVDHGDWDHHVGVGTITYGRMLNSATDVATSLAAFFADLGPLADKVTLVTMSGFGRHVVENAQRGLDHGWGNAMFLAGAGVKGGRYHDENGYQVITLSDCVAATSTEEHEKALTYDYPMFSHPMPAAEFIDQLGS